MNYTESETGAAMCGTCDLWIDGVGSNACVCCTTCGEQGATVRANGLRECPMCVAVRLGQSGAPSYFDVWTHEMVWR